jgi:hypothetical protein
MLDKTSLVANVVVTGLEAYLIATGGRQPLVGLMVLQQLFSMSGMPSFARHYGAALEFKNHMISMI